jgi:hypothetical protein
VWRRSATEEHHEGDEGDGRGGEFERDDVTPLTSIA